MSRYIVYIIIFVLLLVSEFLYLIIARRYGIADVCNERSSHKKLVYRGGGVVFVVAVWIWVAFFGMSYPWFLAGLTLASVVSLIDDIRPLPNWIRLLTHFVAAAMALYQIGIEPLWLFLLLIVVYAGIMNVYNFMDGINGITESYSLAVLIPLYLLNGKCTAIDESLIVVTAVSAIVFCFFNYRPQGKAVCFLGDVGSISMGFIILFILGSEILKTGDITVLLMLVVYGVDACLTICHRIMLHENLGVAHRKHVYQIMANELHIGHLKIASGYAAAQLVISMVYLFVIPDTLAAHWIYFGLVTVVLSAGYVIFMKKYYRLHEEYLSGLKKL